MSQLAPVMAVLQSSPWSTVVGGILVLLLVHRLFFRRSMKLPPGPPNLPIIGAMFSMGTDLHRVFTRLSQKYGPVMYFKLGVLPVVVVSSAEMAEELFKQRDAEFASRAHTQILYSTATYFGFKAQGIGFAPNTPTLQQLRKLSTTEVLTQSKLYSSHAVKVRKEELGAMLREVKHLSQGDKLVKMSDISEGMTMNTVCQILFGKRYYGSDIPVTKELMDFKALMIDMTAQAGKLNISDLLPVLRSLDIQGVTAEFAELHKRQRRIVSGILEDHKKNPKKEGETKDFIDVLLSLKGDEKLTDDQIMSATSDMIIGGTDTAATTVQWVVLELLRHPKVYKKVMDEIDTVVGKNRPLDEADIPNLPYMQAVCKEILRMYPPLTTTIPRMNEHSATKLGGYDIPKNTSLFVNIWAIGRDPKLWDKPEMFLPERFLNVDIGIIGNNFSYLPFGSGRRKCVGINMGQLMVHVTLATLLHAYELSPPKGKEISNEDVYGMVLRPKDPLMVVATPRVPLSLYDDY